MKNTVIIIALALICLSLASCATSRAKDGTVTTYVDPIAYEIGAVVLADWAANHADKHKVNHDK